MMNLENVMQIQAQLFIDCLLIKEDLIQDGNSFYYDYYDRHQDLIDDSIDGSNVLNTALVSKSIFNLLKTWISNNLIFRARSEIYIMYTPKHLLVNKYTPISSYVTHIILTSDYDDNNNNKIHLPSSVIHFQPEKNVKFSPRKLKSLTSLNYMGPTLAYLPPSLTQLTCNFLPRQLPPNLTYLKFQFCTNNDKWEWPTTLKHLTFSVNSISQFIPPFPSLISLNAIGLDFSFCDVPSSLQSLRLLDRHIPTTLPPSLTSLKIDFTHKFQHLPPNLINLVLAYDCIVACPFPNSLRKLKIYTLSENTALPPQLTHLECTFLPPSTILPPTITHLFINNLPTSYDLPMLTHLKLSELKHSIMDGLNMSIDFTLSLTSKITCLSLGGNTEISALPPLLRHLHLLLNYSFPLPPLPSTLISLTLNYGFYHPLPTLPVSLKRLLLYNNGYTHNLPELPPFLKHLVLPEDYDLPLPNIPPNLLRIQCPKEYVDKLRLVPDMCHVMLYESEEVDGQSESESEEFMSELESDNEDMAPNSIKNK